ncbi:MAG: ATP-binding protein, partial [Anaerolineae bacterium]
RSPWSEPQCFHTGDLTTDYHTARQHLVKTPQCPESLVVRDDGQGFDPTQPVPEGHYGLQGMRERAEMVGGVLTVDSAPSRGTTVRFEVEVEPNV